MKKPAIGVVLLQQHGEMKTIRNAWMEAEALGVDAIYTGDHFFAQSPDYKNTASGQITTANRNSQNFEATTLQAAIAATTTRPKIGCIVHGIGFRNPNLMADIARTIDHISGGRYILGLGSGYLEEDYVEYGYPYPSQKARLEELSAAIPVIKSRFEKLNPRPVGKIPILIASMGGPIGMRNVARHADMWNLFGPMDKMRQVCELFDKTCQEVGRDPKEIEKTAIYVPQIMPDNNPDQMYRELGLQQLIAFTQGPDWDLGVLRELLQWRDSLT